MPLNEHDPQPNTPNQPTRATPTRPNTNKLRREVEPRVTCLVADGGYQPLDTRGAISGKELRAVLFDYIADGIGTIARMVKRLAADGYTVWGRASKVVSDALRWEIGRGRVRRVKRGTYSLRRVPKSTYYKIRAHAHTLFFGPTVVAERRDRSTLNNPRTTPPADRHWQEWIRNGRPRGLTA